MSTLFRRHSRIAALGRVLRRRRSATRSGSLVGPVVLAAALAVVGHQVAASTAAAAPTVDVLAHRAPSYSDPFAKGITAQRPGRLVALLDDRGSAAPAASLLARSGSARASRSEARAPLKARQPVVKTASWVRPNGGAVTSPYGKRWGRMHEGLDFGGAHGSPVRAAAGGTVVSAGYASGGYGKQVKIRHGDGIVTTYSHLSSILVSGGRVEAGETIGKVGSTGASTGPHLHFEVLVGGTPVNPRTFLAKRGVRV